MGYQTANIMDPEGRPYLLRGFFGEFMGSFLLIFAGAGAVSIQPFLPVVSTLVVGIGHGLGLMAAIWVAYQISGGHINPLITLMLWVHGIIEYYMIKEEKRLYSKFYWYHALVWILAQLMGAIAAAALLLAIFGTIYYESNGLLLSI